MSKQTQRSQSLLIARSVFMLIVGYILLLATAYVIIVVNDPNNWQTFMRENISGVISLIVCTFLLSCIIYYYYYFEDREFIFQVKNILLIYVILIAQIAFNFVFGKHVNIYARPFTLLALLSLFLFNRRQAVFLNFVYALMMFVIDTYTNNFSQSGVVDTMYYSLMLEFVCGTLSVFVASNIKTRGGLVGTGFAIALPTFAIILLLQLPTINTLGGRSLFISAGWGALGSVLSAVLTLALLPVFEWAFNRLTVFRLRELTRTDAPLLMRLKKEAPGTFNHSLIVAQLSETCALALGENAELARAVAYYHDVGKLKQPDCFTENQRDYNIHDELTPELSADIIRSHAKDGYDLLVANRLPQIFADVAREHHGTLPIKYFYVKAMKISGGDVNIKDYSYRGPTPKSKISAIVMIADASEAAVRSLKERTPEKVEQVVRTIIEERMDLDQFVDCDITMKELTTLRETLVAALSGVHHHRVKYPAMHFGRGGKLDE